MGAPVRGDTSLGPWRFLGARLRGVGKAAAAPRHGLVLGDLALYHCGIRVSQLRDGRGVGGTNHMYVLHRHLQRCNLVSHLWHGVDLSLPHCHGGRLLLRRVGGHASTGGRPCLELDASGAAKGVRWYRGLPRGVVCHLGLLGAVADRGFGDLRGPQPGRAGASSGCVRDLRHSVRLDARIDGVGGVCSSSGVDQRHLLRSRH
mmetsp:Transcript_61898/g.178161  ORF Transcript_61898/g.178161 Transcript_61898/m.178161 type:complete len:203 (-) Transcript_61898:216-824(-)